MTNKSQISTIISEQNLNQTINSDAAKTEKFTFTPPSNSEDQKFKDHLNQEIQEEKKRAQKEGQNIVKKIREIVEDQDDDILFGGPLVDPFNILEEEMMMPGEERITISAPIVSIPIGVPIGESPIEHLLEQIQEQSERDQRQRSQTPFEKDSVEEKLTKDGHHIRKEIHETEGKKILKITTDDTQHEMELGKNPQEFMQEAINEMMEDGPIRVPAGKTIHIHGEQNFDSPGQVTETITMTAEDSNDNIFEDLEDQMRSQSQHSIQHKNIGPVGPQISSISSFDKNESQKIISENPKQANEALQTPGIEVNHVLDRMERMRAKAIHQLEEKLAEPINQIFGRNDYQPEKPGVELNQMQPQAARIAMFVFSFFILILLALVWFVWTCKNNKKQKEQKFDKLKQNDPQDFEENELRSFGDFQGLGSESDEEDQNVNQQKNGPKSRYNQAQNN